MKSSRLARIIDYFSLFSLLFRRSIVTFDSEETAEMKPTLTLYIRTHAHGQEREMVGAGYRETVEAADTGTGPDALQEEAHLARLWARKLRR